jgi:hypothetical protein
VTNTKSEENDPAKSVNNESEEEILALARKRFNLAVEAEAAIRVDALDDLKFRAGEQWPADVRSARDQDKRPCLTINKLPGQIRQVTNDQRQNRPSIKVSPVDDNADIETAKVLQGIIRHIEYNSNADVAYDTAFEGAATKGLGYFRVITDYADPFSFDQEILIKRVRNSFSVYIDPNYHEPDGSDSNWAFIFEDLSHDDYKAQFGKSKMASMDDWKSIGDGAPGWSTKDTCRVAEYFYKTFKQVTLVQLSNGQVIQKDRLPKDPSVMRGITVTAERESVLPAIKWCKINAVEVLEETEWLGNWIPVVPVLGDELDVDGKRILEGMIRHAKDPQRMYNYWSSSATEMIALAPRAPFIGVEGQFEGHEKMWQTANTKNHAFLQYKAKVGGNVHGAPQRQTYEAPVQSITHAQMQAADDLKATTGVYDASLGNRSNENSGVAIQRRNMQSQTGNFHYIDNLSRAMRHLGRILVDLIPKVYDTAKTVRMIGEDGQATMVAINQIFQKDGKDVSHFLGSGKYDVLVATGPSYASKRQEAVASMLDLTKAYPKVAEVAGDLMVRSMDWPGSQEIADRLKKTLPAGLAEDKDQEQSPIPPQIQQQLQQQGQMIQQLTQELHVTHDSIDRKVYEIESKERIEMKKLEVEVEIEMARIGSVESINLLKHEVGQIENRMAMLKFNMPVDVQPPPQNQIENPSLENSASGPSGAAMPEQQQPPTGGSAPGQIMGG